MTPTNNTPTAALRAVMRDLTRLGELSPHSRALAERVLAEQSKNAKARRYAAYAQERRLRRVLDMPSIERVA